MTPRALIVTAAIACGGCNAIQWNFESAPDASAGTVADAPAGTLADASGEELIPGLTDTGVTVPAVSWALCGVDGGCPTPGLHCSAASGQCFPCLQDVQCTDRTLTACDLTGDGFQNLCVECTHDGDCSSGEVCVSNQCVMSCSNSNDCTKSSASKCNMGICVSCRQASDCPNKGDVCNTVTGRCGNCTLDAQCPSFKPHCDPRTNSCVRCLSTIDCGEGICDPETQSCVGSGAKMWAP